MIFLMVALYLPPHAIAIQLVPFGGMVNFDEFGAILSQRGPYLEWHNTIKVCHNMNIYISEHYTYLLLGITVISS